MESPQKASLKLPDELPLIVLSDCFHFPQCVLPLYIFEERYRAMLAHALRTHRMFGVGVRVRRNSDDILPVTTVGLISACVTQNDGTSHLLLHGLKRARITGFSQDGPFKIAQIEKMECPQASSERIKTLRSQVMASLPVCQLGAEQAMRQLCDKLLSTDCPEALCDILTYHFVNSPRTLAKSLTEPCLEKRYQILLNELRSDSEPE
ncbi:MAG: LON peptidase substrate-binding domain-containing protein [Verrucomicrobiaceae bacterium]|nr:LON peptidase substrate-binding domain-containing protein [Verrucomicrobiaceae bacterium]